jgi:predicted glycosyltransferase
MAANTRRPNGAASMISVVSQARTSRKTYGDGSEVSLRSIPKKIWIDLDNSPHVPFFLPIIEGLEREGYQILLTARDSYQVCELLRLHHLSCRVVGRHYGKRQILKLLGTGLRATQLLPLAMTEKPDLVVSHGSRAQFLVGLLLRIPTIMMFDYEFVNATGFLHPDWLFVPEVIPAERLSQRPDHVFRYRGLKEDVYVPRLRPDPSVRNLLGVRKDELVVTVRPPATEAHYHNPEGEQFLAACLEFLLDQSTARIVMLPRNQNQATILRSRWTRAIEEGRIVIPEKAVDGLNLIWNSDLVISGGGTMNREAAALGIPVYSIFRGRIGAVDQYLARTGRLTVIERVEDIPTKIVLKRRTPASLDLESQGVALDCILQAIISIVEHKCLPHGH